MNTFILYFCSSFIVINLALSQPNPGARQNGIGNASVGISADAGNIFSNPASLSNIKNFDVTTFFSPSPFGLKELSISALAVVKNFQFLTAGLAFQTYGFELYRENRFIFSVSKELFDKFSLGFNFNFNHLSIKNYGSKSVISFDAGIIFELIQNFHFGSSITNFSGSGWNNETDKLRQVFRNGISFSGVKDLILCIEIEKVFYSDFNLKTGGEFSPIKNLFLRMGYGLEPAGFSAGLGLNLFTFFFDYGITTHQELGLTHNLGLTFKID